MNTPVLGANTEGNREQAYLAVFDKRAEELTAPLATLDFSRGLNDANTAGVAKVVAGLSDELLLAEASFPEGKTREERIRTLMIFVRRHVPSDLDSFCGISEGVLVRSLATTLEKKDAAAPSAVAGGQAAERGRIAGILPLQ